jgi:hypothetical protein
LLQSRCERALFRLLRKAAGSPHSSIDLRNPLRPAAAPIAGSGAVEGVYGDNDLPSAFYMGLKLLFTMEAESLDGCQVVADLLLIQRYQTFI